MIISKLIRRTILYAFLCIYLFAVVKPILPIANDIIAHSFYKLDHLATIHVQNGKYHVHIELALEANQQKSDPKKTTSVFLFDNLANHLLNKNKKLLFEVYRPLIKQTYFFNPQNTAAVFMKNPTPPPKV